VGRRLERGREAKTVAVLRGRIVLVTSSREVAELSDELPAWRVKIRKLVTRSFCDC